MLRTRNDQPTLWESVLPPEVLRLPAELARVDVLLDDERFFAPFRAYFDLTLGRPSIPVETYLRLMFLKVRYRLGYESLCAEAGDSIAWRLFCRIGIDGRVPHPTTLMKITTRCRSEVIDQLNEALLAKAPRAPSRCAGRTGSGTRASATGRRRSTTAADRADHKWSMGAPAIGAQRPTAAYVVRSALRLFPGFLRMVRSDIGPVRRRRRRRCLQLECAAIW